MTLAKLQACELLSMRIVWYRAHHDPNKSMCWMDEWACGYIAASRDIGMIDAEQANFLFEVFQPELDNEHLG